jgi:hypothetical protein
LIRAPEQNRTLPYLVYHWFTA